MDLKRSISVSRSRKLNLAHYGGQAFESEDFFVSMSEEIEADSKQEHVDAVYGRLMQECDDKLRDVVKSRVAEIQNPPKMNRCDMCGGRCRQPYERCSQCRSSVERGVTVPDTVEGLPFK